MQRKRRTLLAGAVAAVVAGGVAGGNAFHATATPVGAATRPVAPATAPAAATSAPLIPPVTGVAGLPAAPPAVVADPIRAGELTGHLLQRVLAVLSRLVALITRLLADPPR